MKSNRGPILPAAFATVAGLFAGGCIVVQVVVMPYLSALKDTTALGPAFVVLLSSMGAVMAPLLGLTVFLGTVVLVQSFRRNADRRVFLGVGMATLLAVVAITVVVHVPRNAEILGAVVPTGERLLVLLRQWDFWHRIRTLFAVILLAVAVGEVAAQGRTKTGR